VMIVVLSFLSVIIHIHRPALSLDMEVDLEKGFSPGMFNSCIVVISGARITSLCLFDDGGGDIVTVIRDMGINMMPGLVIMGNHFPPVRLAMIGEIGMPLPIGRAPLGVTRFRIILLK